MTNDRTSPPGFQIEWDLGCIHRFAPPGTAELRAAGDGGYVVVPDRDEGAPRLSEPRHPDCLGFLEEAPLPLLDALEAAWHPASRSWILISGEDPLRVEVEQPRFLGFLEPYPNRPRLAPPQPLPTVFQPLLRSIDLEARRHRYSIGAPAAGTVTMVLGGVLPAPQEDTTPLWVADGRVWTDAATEEDGVAGAKARLRWAAAPLAWRDAARLDARGRAIARRVLDLVRVRPTRTWPTASPGGWLFATAGPERQPLYTATHPATRDQLLTPWPREAGDMGYGPVTLLGWTSARLQSVPGIEPRRVDIPWASRWGRSARRA